MAINWEDFLDNMDAIAKSKWRSHWHFQTQFQNTVLYVFQIYYLLCNI